MKRMILLIAVLLAGCVPQVVNDGNEPPANPYLADSPWSMTHRNSYCQASSPYPGPDAGIRGKDYIIGMPGCITMPISGKYHDGSRVVWGNNLTHVFKLSTKNKMLHEIDKIKKDPNGDGEKGLVESGVSGAYTLVDKDGVFFVPDMTRIVAYCDSVPGDPSSKIKIRNVYCIPEQYLKGSDDKIVGLVMTYDGMLAFATNNGLVCVLSRSFEKGYYLMPGEDDEISNSIACDEKGGIYVVTSRKMYRVQWTGTELSTDEAKGGWIADYETGGDQSGIRLGNGSGTTPTLMGTGSQDRFVAITDGSELMNIVLFWRDEIPADWHQIPGTKDRRIAAQVPVRFGDPEAKHSQTDQSLCIRGYGAVVVNNELGADLGNRTLNIIISGIPLIAPRGMEKFEWNHKTRTFSSVWANTQISVPNGIPCMSASTKLLYAIGKRGIYWTLEAVDWDTGDSAFYSNIGIGLQYNSAYAATQVGLDGCIYSGTAIGLVNLRPK
ncbi:MAG TPA: hypothetical protein VIS94_03090 [Desulfomonilia bacterium]